MATHVLKAWSFSRYNLYQQCPRKFKLSALDKIPQPGNAAMDRGAHIHDLCEDYIKGKIGLPKELKEFDDFKKLFQRLRRQYKKAISGLEVEDNWAFTKDWDQTQWDDWVACWVRIKLDCAEKVVLDDGRVCLNIRDWKTGKYRPDDQEAYKQQLELYALAGLLMHPDVDIVRPYLVYLDQGIVYPNMPEDMADMEYIQTDVKKLIKVWNKRVTPMFKDKTFAPKPNFFCKWCHYRKSNTALNGTGRELCKY